MNSNEEVMNAFYTAFSKKDADGMNRCYADDIIFNDPAFGILQDDAVKAMWSMLCKNAKDFHLEFSNVECDDEYGTCNWVARYTFSKTGRKVVNKVKAHMRFRNGKIIEHTDEFNFYDWSKQALGLMGLLFGWSSFIKRKVRMGALKSLGKYMENKQCYTLLCFDLFYLHIFFFETHSHIEHALTMGLCVSNWFQPKLLS